MPHQQPPSPRRRVHQAVLRPALAISLLFAVVATLGVAEARAQSFALEASAPTRAAAASALSARAGRECGLTRLNRGWITDHRLRGRSAAPRASPAPCRPIRAWRFADRIRQAQGRAILTPWIPAPAGP